MALMAPRMDIHESENALEINAELPGVSQNDVDLRIEGDVLTVRGEKRNERQDKQAHIVERSYESFQRSVQLPFAPDPAQVEASFDHGVLTVVLPKKGQQEKAQKIQIGGSKPGQKTIEGTATEKAQGKEAKAAANGQGRDRLPNAGECLRIVGRGAGPQAHPLAIVAGDHPITIELDFLISRATVDLV
jgi:HSP20 family protein